MALLKDIVKLLESFAPLGYQESYDNAGLLTGDINKETNSALLTVDVTEAVVDEAIRKNIALIISHHPLVFTGIKKFTGKNYVERALIKLIKNDISLYSAHTNIDNVIQGVNAKICDKIGLSNSMILVPMQGELRKLVTFVPSDHAEKVRMAIFNAGAGVIGGYDWCSFNLEGTGTFRGSENTNPFVGEKGKLHFEKEVRIETIFPKKIQNKVINAMIETHPYEEVAYDIYPLDNEYGKAGSGMMGTFSEPVETEEFLNNLKKSFNVPIIRHSEIIKEKISKVAVCGGSGAFLIQKAIEKGADIFVTGEIKYHQYFEAENKIILAELGHYESEQFTKEIFYELLTKNLSNFAVHFSEINSNPIYYY